MDEEEDILILGKGLAGPDPYDPRDYPLETQFGAAPPVEWKKETLGRYEPRCFNQGSSDSCVACATTNIHDILTRKHYSRKDVFAQIAIPHGYGAYLRDGVKLLCDLGQQTQEECPDPASPTPANMRVRCPNPGQAADDKEQNYFVIKHNIIDAVAQGIRDYKAVMFGVTLSSAGWKDKTNPRPPKPGEPTDDHAITGFDFHLHNNKKCILAKSSWCRGDHHVHHINEDYWAAGKTFNGWCVIPKEDQYMTNSILVKQQIENGPNGETRYQYGFFDPVTAESALISDMRNRGINPPLNPTDPNKLDWEKVEPLVGGVITSIK